MLVTSSNRLPEQQLPDPLHHPLFEPGIALLRARLDVVAVDGPVDHRTRPRPAAGFAGGAYLGPGSALPPGLPRPGPAVALAVHGRTVRARAAGPGVAWFGFGDLCAQPTSVRDVLDLADRHPTWVVEDLPPLRTTAPDTCRRFADLVDVLVDRDLPLFLLAGQPLADTLRGPLPLDVTRTASRLALLPDRAATPPGAATPAGSTPPRGWRRS